MSSFSARREAQGAKGLLGKLTRGIGLLTAPEWMPAIFNQGQQSSALTQGINRAAGSVPGLRPNPKTDIGRRLGNELSYAAGQVLQGRTPYAPSPKRQLGQQAVLNGRPVYWAGDDYGWQRLSGGGSSLTMDTLNAPGVQNRFIQDEDYGVFGGSPAADRAYQQEVSRVAQLTAQDPELQRYEAARRVAATPGATPAQVEDAEELGMQMWAKANPTLAARVQPGQAGFETIYKSTGSVPAPSFNPLMQRTFGYQTGGSPSQQMGDYTMGPSPLVPQVDQALNPASPTFAGGEGMPLMNFGADNVTPEMIEAYQKQLLDRAKTK